LKTAAFPRRRELLLCALPLLPAPVGAAAAGPAPWPARAVRILVAYPPGGVSDEVARAIADRLGPRLGVPVLVENRPGAAGSLAMELLSRSPPDGHTLCFSAITPLTVLPHLGPVKYDPLADISPVVSIMATPVLVVGTSVLHAGTLGETVAQARRRPGSLRWATSGIGTTGHMVLERVRRASGIQVTHVPYKGGGQQLNDALSGQFELLSTNVAARQLEYVRTGRLKPLAVGASSRLPVLPEIPTLAEAGFPEANLMSLFGLFSPGRTPSAVVERINAEVNEVLRQPDVRQRMLAVDNLPMGGSAASFATHVVRESEANRRSMQPGGPPTR
jgi:tripartite-type tricarboxylate transporter receptor subunit TctC